MRLHGWKHDVIALAMCALGALASFVLVTLLRINVMWMVAFGVPVGVIVGVYLGLVDLREARARKP